MSTRPVNPIIPKLSTQADLERECLTKANAGLSTLCVFALLPPLEEEFPESVEQHKQLIATIAAVKRHFFEQTEKEVIAAAKAASEDGTTSASLLPTYLFSWMDGTAPEATKFVSKFGLSSDLPSMMVD